MKTFLLSSVLSICLVSAAVAADPDDPVAIAIQKATVVQPNPPPTTVPPLPPGPDHIVQPPNAQALPRVAGGSNAVFVANGQEEPASSVIDRLSPNMAPDSALDALTRERARIRLIGDYQATFRGIATGDAVRAVAEFAHMRYMAPADNSLNGPINISGTYNLLDLLDMFQEYYSVSMSFERGIWRFSRATPWVPVLRVYSIKNNDRESVDISSPDISSGVSTSANGATGGGSTGGNMGGSSNGSFKVSYDALIKDVQDLISTTPPGEHTAGDASGLSDGKGAVKFIPETGDLFVLASPYHQGLVKEYLAKVDQPLDEIEFSAYFVETSRNPSQALGINWNNAISSTISGTSPSTTSTVTTATGTATVNVPTSSKFTIPSAGILNAYQFAAALQMTAGDSQSSVVQNPVVVGLPNRKTVLDATTQIPYQNGSTASVGGVSSAVSSSVSTLDVGTIVNIYPVVRHREDGSRYIRLNISLVVSSLVGDINIGGSPVPETSRRRFEFTSEVGEGDTLCIGGLVSSSASRSISKIPFLGDIPVLGTALFGSNTDTATRTNLIVYITPRILTAHSQSAMEMGLPRVWPVDDSFSRPVFVVKGASLASLRASLDGFSRELDAVHVYIDQRRDPKDIVNRLRSLSAELDLMRDYLKSVRRDKRAVIDPALLRQVDSLYSQSSGMRRSLVMDTAF